MQKSKSKDTDGHVLTCLRHANLFNQKFENDVLFTALYIWEAAMRTMPSKFKANAELRRLVDPKTSLECLQTKLSSALLRLIYQIKQEYLLSESTWDQYERSLVHDCCILTCFEPAGEFGMNRLWYCDEHKGLALFNGLRHSPMIHGRRFCDACSLWNILALKTTMSDEGHVQAAAHNTRVPGYSHFEHEILYEFHRPPLRTYRRWIATGKDPYDDFFNVGDETGYVYWDRTTWKEQAVKPHSWIYVDPEDAKERAAAWIYVERKDPVVGYYEPVTNRNQFLEIMDRIETLETGLCLRADVANGGPTYRGHHRDGLLRYSSRTLDAD